MTTPEPKTEATSAVDSVACNLCADGVMRRAIIKPYNVNAGIALIVVGLLCVLTGALGLVGLIMLCLGIYFTAAKKEVWLCDSCNAMIERR